MTDRFLLKLVVLLGWLGAAATAAAGPWPTKTGIAASTQDATVAGNNPAAMTRFDEKQMKFEILGFFSENTFEGEAGEDSREFSSDGSSTTIGPMASMGNPGRDNLWFGWTIQPAVDTPAIEVTISDDSGSPVNGSDAVFAAVAAATWRQRGHPTDWPTG